MLAVRVCLSGCMIPAAMRSGSEPAAAYTFERYEVAIGAAERQTVLTGFFSGGSVADLAAVSIDGSGDRRLLIFASVDGERGPATEATLRSDVSFVDVANIHGRDRLIAYGDGRLTGLDRVYGADGYRYRPWEEGGRIHQMDYDRDGRGDLVFWNEDHFAVHLQDEDGLFPAKASTTFTTGWRTVCTPTGPTHRARSGRRRRRRPAREPSGRRSCWGT